MPNMNKFAQAAQEALSLSRIMEGREKLETEEILGQELTVDEFDIVTLDGKNFGVCHFAEYPNHYYNGGAILTKLFASWASLYSGDIEAASNGLKKEGGVRIMLSAAKTKKGNNLTAVSLLYN